MHFKPFGKYTIIKKLTSGGMADILLAADLNPTGYGRFIVIKRVLSKFSENEEFKDMFKNEGKVACNLKHRNITPIYEFGIEKNQFFLSMEYISGRNLREFIKKIQKYKTSISIPNSVHIIKEIASGLNYAHNAIDSNTGQPLNLIHRDISPQNIMLSFDGEIKLIDFGIAKISDTNLTRAGHLKGKFSYMSPEQANGDPLDERTDVFCLGIILWELLTNKRLFASKNELSSLKKIKNCEIPNAQKINPEIPTELNNILKKSLSKNKNSRYKTAAKFEQDLIMFLNKTHSEYSHYDFISLVKKLYRKQIMEERETLKTYSSEFKKYINTLNIEENFESTMIDLNIPDLTTLENKKEQTKTKSLQMNDENSIHNEMSVSNTNNYLSERIKNQDNSLRMASQIMKEDSTLIQKKDNDTETEQKTIRTKKSAIKTNPTQQNNLHRTNNKSLALNLKNNSEWLQNKSSFLQSTKNTTQRTSSISLYDRHSILLDNDYKSKKKSAGRISLFLFMIALFSSPVLFYFLNNKYNIVDFVTNSHKDTDAIESTLTNQAQKIKTVKKTSTQNSSNSNIIQIRKLFVNSKPSGAAIYINDQFSSKYTPSLITFKSNKALRITLKKEGYIIEKIKLNPKKETSSLNVKLKSKARNISADKIYILQ